MSILRVGKSVHTFFGICLLKSGKDMIPISFAAPRITTVATIWIGNTVRFKISM